jgi:hypothetical protein
MNPTHPANPSGRLHVESQAHRPGVPPDSELAPCEPPPLARDVLPHPEGQAGGIDNIPEECLGEGQRLEDELNHAGLDEELPGEDQARAEPEEGRDEARGERVEVWGKI